MPSRNRLPRHVAAKRKVLPNQICYDLNSSEARPITDIKTFPDEPGIYMILEGENDPLYVGQSKHIKTRLKQHRYGKRQAIDKHLKPLLLRNQVYVKYVLQKNPSSKESQFVECMEKILRRNLPYNMRRGNTV